MNNDNILDGAVNASMKRLVKQEATPEDVLTLLIARQCSKLDRISESTDQYSRDRRFVVKFFAIAAGVSMSVPTGGILIIERLMGG